MEDRTEEHNSERNEKIQNQANDEQDFVAVGPKQNHPEHFDHQHLVYDPDPPGIERAVDQKQVREKDQRIHNDTCCFESTVFEAVANCQVDGEVEKADPEKESHEDVSKIRLPYGSFFSQVRQND